MVSPVMLLAVLPTAFVPSVHRLRSTAPTAKQDAPLVVRMQTLTPDAPTIETPGALPETWVVPDTFTFPKTLSDEPPFYKLTLFKSSSFDAEYVAGALIKVVGLEEHRAREIAKQAQTLGFACVGEYVQEVAETYSDGLKGKSLVVDISAV
jgi:ATP-dependent Clp protease adapter protein ClpS